MNWLDEENPNKVTREHFELAIKEAEQCTPERPGKVAPKVGAVIVKDGKVISKSHRHQVGYGDHAEFIAFEQRGIDKVDFIGADLITTLEPCTEKRHGKEKKPCADWVKLRRIRKVWIGTLDRNPHIRGKAVMYFHDLGIHVGWFPDDLMPKLLEQNKEFFEFTRMMTPQLTSEELEERRIEIRDLVQHELSSYKIEFKSMKQIFRSNYDSTATDSGTSFGLPDPHLRNQIIDFAQIPIDALQDTLSRLMTMDLHNVDDWTKIGFKILLAHEAGCVLFKGIEEVPVLSGELKEILNQKDDYTDIEISKIVTNASSGEASGNAAAGRAFDTAIKLNGTNREAIIGKSTVDIFMEEYDRAFENLETTHHYLEKPDEEIADLYKKIARHFRRNGLPRSSTAYRRAGQFSPP